MQLIQIILVLTIGSVVAALVASRSAAHDGGFVGGVAPKILVGIGIGLLGALSVSTLFGDVVPDDWEGPGLFMLACTITLTLLGAFVWRRVAR